MLDISIQNFESDLIAASLQQPVLLDIWAPWCGPCKTLGPMLEKLEESYAGRFTLAKLNADEQPEIAGQLSQMFGVRSIPLCVMFKDGQPVDGFVGAVPEAQVRSFLDKHVPSAEQVASQEEAEQAESLLAAGDVSMAIEKLQEAVAINPGNDAARYEYLRALLSAGRVADARRVYGAVAANVIDPRIVACGHWLQACERTATGRSPTALEEALMTDKRDFDTRFELAQHHFAKHEFAQAMDQLLEILMRDKTWNDGLARRTYVAVLEVMRRSPPPPTNSESVPPKIALAMSGNQPAVSADPIMDLYRRKLSMVVF